MYVLAYTPRSLSSLYTTQVILSMISSHVNMKTIKNIMTKKFVCENANHIRATVYRGGLERADDSGCVTGSVGYRMSIADASNVSVIVS